jgi:probable F420-dependent oxidoreductase
MTAEQIRFACLAAPAGPAPWLSLAQRLEGGGFEALCVADHPGTTVSPMVSLAAAAPATSSLRLGTAVLNGGVREPLDIANDVAALSLLSGGRAILGLGAGHTPHEWHAVGRPYPSPADRIRRLGELARLVERLLAGEVVDHDDEWFTLRSAHLDVTPAERVPLLIGGSSHGTIRVGAQLADIVELGGTGRTLPDGHFHEVRWQPHQIDRAIAAFDDAASSGPTPTLGALVQLVVITDDAERAARRFLENMATRQSESSLPTVAEVLEDVPFVFMGTVAEVAHQVRHVNARWGFSRFTVREPAIDGIIDVIAELESSE